MDCNQKKWDVDPKDIEDDRCCGKWQTMYNEAWSVHQQRLKGHEFYTRVAHMKSLYGNRKGEDHMVSEGSTQAMKRRIRAEAIQRVPEGEIVTQYDKNSIEQAEIEFIFKKKILSSEYDGRDMLKNLWRTFGAAYDYGYACVRTGFENDLDGDVRISYKLISYNDVIPATDCDFIEEAQWYIVREYMSYTDVMSLYDFDRDDVKDSTYSTDTVRYIIEHKAKDAQEPNSIPLADRENSVSNVQSIEIRTLYKRGCDEFTTYVPSLNAVLRTVKNYDPRKDVPLHFMILDPDAEFPLGCSSIMWTLGSQQFADCFQTLVYQTLNLATQPPLMVFGNLTNPKIRMTPRAIWPMGTNPNNKIEPFRVETGTISNFSTIQQTVQQNMVKNLNLADGTVATDANVMGYSATPQGVEMQRREKSVTVNTYQKRVEVFFSEWANHALRSYIASCSGKIKLTVDETTRRRINDIEATFETEPELDIDTLELKMPDAPPSIIDGDKIEIDFDALSSDMLEFEVRTGSLEKGDREQEIQQIQQLIVPVSQMLSGVSEQNKAVFENTVLQLVGRLCELSNINVSAQTAKRYDDQLVLAAMQATMEKVQQQQQQIQQLMAQMQPQQPMMPPQGQPMPPEAMMPGVEQPLPEEPLPMGAPEQAMAPSPQPVPAELPAGEEGLAPDAMPVM